MKVCGSLITRELQTLWLQVAEALFMYRGQLRKYLMRVADN